ncbi:MAG: GNAT family N-acetyltransferase [Acidobacteriota bacterium]|nr:MAG: GNAT family N-acetyltransferase [Acidobacteriota bacterium]
MRAISIEPLTAEHRREDFDCGEGALNRYIRQYASQHQKKNIGRVYVAVEPGEKRVIGYYTLANGSVAFENVPKSKGLPREYPIPVVMLARLAIDRTMQGQGLGAVLLFDALKRSAEVSLVSAAHAVIVDALNDRAKEFYLHYQFEEGPGDPKRLFLPMHDIISLLGQTR